MSYNLYGCLLMLGMQEREIGNADGVAEVLSYIYHYMPPEHLVPPENIAQAIEMLEAENEGM